MMSAVVVSFVLSLTTRTEYYRRHGRRKPCMLIPIFGELITSIGLILCTYFEQTPVEAAAITETLFTGLTGNVTDRLNKYQNNIPFSSAGGWFTMLMGVFSYVADITTKEDRTLRIGIVNLCISLGVPIGMAFSGILLKLASIYPKQSQSYAVPRLNAGWNS